MDASLDSSVGLTVGDDANMAAVARMLTPSSIAIIGASDKSRWSATAFENLTQGGFTGKVHLVNPRGAMAHGRQVARSCAEIGLSIDIGLIMTPPAAVAAALVDLAKAGVRSAVILTAGFAETGAPGQALQDQLRQVAAEQGIRLLGPNCLGFINFVSRAYVWTTPVMAPSRNTGVAIVSQSGATAYFLSTLAYQQDVGLSYVVSTGNEADLDGACFVDYFINDPHTRSIAVFAETFRDPVRLRRVAERALTVGKPLVMLKVGSSEVTAKSAMAHTGALVGDDRVFDGICQQFGIIRVRSMEELLATADVVGRTGLLRPGGLCIVTNSGGVGEIAADTADFQGIQLPVVACATAVALQDVLPDTATAHNPLDLTGSVTPEQCERALRTLGGQADYAAVLCPWYEIPTTADQINPRLTELHRHITRGMAALSVPGLLVSYTNTRVNAMASDIIAETGANYLACGLDRALSGLAGAFWWSQRQREHASRAVAPVVHHPVTHERPRSEHEALGFLSRQGVPVVPASLAVNADEAVLAARALGGRVVIKVASPDIAHKSDIGGVALNLLGDDAVRDAAMRVLAAAHERCPGVTIEGVIVAPMRERGIELFVGYTCDPQWGPILAVGLGGVWVEILEDVALRPLPVDADEIKRMLGSLRGAKLLMGQRGVPAADLDAVASAIARIGDAILRLGPDLEALDVNPLWVRGSEVEALDALFVWRTPDSRAVTVDA
ncbi:MAG: acetate--CoA ligase family protein [Burkholderiaceae bacterium]|nr:acetate--CoA ligase family protein [Burkholderiaceae bacterium]